MSSKIIAKTVRRTTAEPTVLGLQKIALAKIREAENPIRSKYTNIPKLARSLKTYGLIHPPLVMPISDPKFDYEIVAGNRRLRALRRAKWTEAWFMVLQEGISDFDAMFYTGIENIQIDSVDRIDKGKWALVLKDMPDPRNNNKKPSFKEIAERIGEELSTLHGWVDAARTATNLEIAAEEWKEEAKIFFAKLSKLDDISQKKLIFPTAKDLGIYKLKVIRSVAKSPEETARLAMIIKYKKLTHKETDRFVNELREHPERDPILVATEIKGTLLYLQLPHTIRSALSKYAGDKRTTIEQAATSILCKTLKEGGYL